ncbi:Alkaline ceramidase 3 [Orbilia oligospora]|uniref:Alkaline ceramidase 3 n=1 Tax=Orbilia oligospora TaxID=2813651 RepID=A0A7C8U7A3_ORBOL|nr:Alkaline ceramidase 3 [Orbilia oligospora]KAF3215234.1 Alkaline ceramidase 3 [Orbilia oligospora]
MTISSIFQPRPSTPSVGLWGLPTSSVNWCESDYTITFYIAEFFNSCSSLCMVSFGLLGQWSLSYLSKNVNSTPRPRRPDPVIYDPLQEHPRLIGVNRIWSTWFALQIVGWGSVAFHGSLQWWSQAFDEVPMVWTAILHLSTGLVGRYDPFPLATSSSSSSSQTEPKGWVASYLVPQLRRSSGSNGEPYTPIITATFLAHAVTCSLLLTLFRGPSQFVIFHILFGSVELAGFFLTYTISKEASDPSHPRGVGYIKGCHSDAVYKSLLQRHQKDVKTLHKRGLWFYCIAICIWSTDLNFCEYISRIPFIYPSLSLRGFEWVYTTFNPQGHAWWHLLVSIGFYHLGILVTYDRMLAGYRTFWEGVERKEPGCLELLKEEKVKGRIVGRKGDVPVIEWVYGWIPVVAMWRPHVYR